MRIVAFSDTHGLHHQLSVPDGDVLVCAGDFMNSGHGAWEVSTFADWFLALPHKFKILVAGNHDRKMETWAAMGIGFSDYFPGVAYLQDSGVVHQGLLFWGSPYTPEFCNWAFNVPRDQLYLHWAKIPENTDVLITHGPPWGKLDGPYPVENLRDQILEGHLGDVSLKYKVEEIMPSVHIFGHCHKCYGTARDICTDYYNVAVCNERYKVVNPCTIIDF